MASRPSPIRYDRGALLRALAPALVAIVLAIVTRQVIVSLSAGIFVAAIMMLAPTGVYNPIRWVTFAVDQYLFGVLAWRGEDGVVEHSHLKILVFTLFIGAMVGVIEANGGTRAMVSRVTRRVRSRRSGQLGALAAGVVVFFDDYANAMIVGPSVRPIFDRLRISREKLAYIVDSTAAPVSSIFIGTWLAAEISYLNEGFGSLGRHVPEFLEGLDGTQAFWASIPYRTYALLALVMVFFIAVTGRDFGAMRKAERRAAADDLVGAPSESGETTDATGSRWWLGALPVLVLVGVTIGLLFYTGYRGATAERLPIAWNGVRVVWDSVKLILGNADSYPALVYGSLSAMVVAVVISKAAKVLSLAQTMDAVVSGMCRMFAACIVLVLAWGLSQGGKELNLGEQARAFLQEQVGRGTFSPLLLPPVIFLTACFVSFSTGTSWGPMGFLCPAVIPIAAGVLAGRPTNAALPLFYGTVGAVLTGAVFGDHCSPISDTTVLSSIASECDLSRHVWTQMPYAVAVAIVGILCTDGLNYVVWRWEPPFFDRYLPLCWAYGLVLGALVLLLLLLAIGRRPSAGPSEPHVGGIV